MDPRYLEPQPCMTSHSLVGISRRIADKILRYHQWQHGHHSICMHIGARSMQGTALAYSKPVSPARCLISNVKIVPKSWGASLP